MNRKLYKTLHSQIRSMNAKVANGKMSREQQEREIENLRNTHGEDEVKHINYAVLTIKAANLTHVIKNTPETLATYIERYPDEMDYLIDGSDWKRLVRWIYTGRNFLRRDLAATAKLGF